MSRKKGAFVANYSFIEQEILRAACQKSPAQQRTHAFAEIQILQIAFDQKIAMNPVSLQQLFYVDLSPSLSCPRAVTAGRSLPAGTRNLGHCGSHRFPRDSGCQPPALHGSVHHAGHGSNALPAGLPGLLWCHP